jgi:RHS repeat-associated protein
MEVRVEFHIYDAFHRLCNYSVSSLSRYTGKERDAESGLDFFGARYYGSMMGRFMSPDDGSGVYADSGNPQSWNLYGYVQNNPLSNVDPDGHDCIYLNGDNTLNLVQSGDCTTDTDAGYYVDGTVSTINENSQGQVTG